MAAHGFVCLWGVGATLQPWRLDFSLHWLLLLQSMGSRAQVQQFRRVGLVALQHVGSSGTRDQTHVPCVGMWILNHWTTLVRDAAHNCFKSLVYTFTTMYSQPE